MDKPSEIKKYIKQIVGATLNLPVTAVVKSVTDDHCSVELKSGLVLTDVKLKATISTGSDYLRLLPKVGSTVVMISLTGTLDNLSIIKVDEIEKVEYSQNGLEVLIDSTDKKVSIKNDTCSLVDVLTDLVMALKGLKVFTPVGPSGTPLPDTILKLEQFETKFKTLLK